MKTWQIKIRSSGYLGLLSEDFCFTVWTYHFWTSESINCRSSSLLMVVIYIRVLWKNLYFLQFLCLELVGGGCITLLSPDVTNIITGLGSRCQLLSFDWFTIILYFIRIHSKLQINNDDLSRGDAWHLIWSISFLMNVSLCLCKKCSMITISITLQTPTQLATFLDQV